MHIFGDYETKSDELDMHAKMQLFTIKQNRGQKRFQGMWENVSEFYKYSN